MAQEHLFEIRPAESNNSVLFTVKSRPSLFYKYIRVPFATLLAAYVAQLIYTLDVKPHEIRVPRSIYELEVFVYKWALVSVMSLAAFLLLGMRESCDSLMVMEGLGVQLSSRGRWWFWNNKTSDIFIPSSDIIDLVIHEGLHGYGQVIFYMCVLIRTRGTSNDNMVKLVFPNFLPKKHILLQVWRHSRSMLFKETRRHFRRVPGQGLREVEH